MINTFLIVKMFDVLLLTRTAVLFLKDMKVEARFLI